MSFFEKIFGRGNKTEGKQEIKEEVFADISIKDARRLVEEKNSDPNLLEKCGNMASSITGSIEDLRNAFKNLRDAGIPEPRAHASKIIKDGFAERAIARLENIPEAYFSTLRDVNEFVGKISLIIGGLHVGPTESSHLKFFFEEQMKGIAALMGRILNETNELGLIARPVAERCENILKLLDEIERKRAIIAEKREGAKMNKILISELERRILSVEFHDVSGLRGAKEEFTRVEEEIKAVEGEVDSIIGPLSKVLKKAEYLERDRRKAEMIAAYLDSPHKALMMDNSFEIKSIVRDILSASKTYAMFDIDTKILWRAEQLRDNPARLEELRERMIVLENRLKDAKSRMDAEEGKEKENVRIQNMLENMNAEKIRLSEAVERLEKEAEAEEEKLAGLVEKTSEEIGVLMGKRIRVIAT